MPYINFLFIILANVNILSPYNNQSRPVQYLQLDMTNYCTWSFPEFMPFCTHLYYISSFKKFDTIA